jgi:hypothetical protein
LVRLEQERVEEKYAIFAQWTRGDGERGVAWDDPIEGLKIAAAAAASAGAGAVGPGAGVDVVAVSFSAVSPDGRMG